MLLTADTLILYLGPVNSSVGRFIEGEKPPYYLDHEANVHEIISVRQHTQDLYMFPVFYAIAVKKLKNKRSVSLLFE